MSTEFKQIQNLLKDFCTNSDNSTAVSKLPITRHLNFYFPSVGIRNLVYQFHTVEVCT